MHWWMYLCLVISLWINFTDAASVRLTGGGSTYGYVEQNIGGVLKPVCPGENDETDKLAPVVCKELGFDDGSAYKMTTPVTASEWWYNEFTRSEQTSVIPTLDAYVTKKWISVSRTGQYAHCQSSTLALRCTGKVRLDIASRNTMPSISERGFGRVVLSPANKNSGYIDPSAIDATGAGIICKELGFNTSSLISDDQVVGSGQNVNTYVTDKYTCAGTETSILDCTTSPVTNPSYKPAVLACTNSDIPDGTVRIGEDHSLVEIRYNNAWGLICGDGFTETDALVVCKSLGFNNGTASKMSTNYGLNRLYPVWIKSLNCGPENTKPADCNKDLWDARCSKMAQARCFNTETEGVYTLTTGGGSLGNHFIERSSKNQKGILAIIRDKDNDPAPKLCKSLGYSSGSDFNLPGPTTLPQGKYWLAVYTSSYTTTECITIDECFKNDWTLTEDLSKVRDYVKLITCHNSVYLKGNGLSGIVNYEANSQKYTIDDATINTEEVNLICKELGFPDGGRKVTEKLFSSQTGDGMVNMVCPSGASDIKSCTFTTIADTNNLVPAVLACNLPANLPDGIYTNDKGVVYFNKNNNPVQFCIDDKEWTDKEASVACRQLGYSSSSYNTESRRENSAVGYKTVTCNGNEESLSECTLVETTSGECSKVAAVTCYNPDDTKFELRDGGDRYGRVWVTRGNKQGYFCSEKFGEEEASTICRELGFKGGNDFKMPPVTASGTKWWYINTNCGDDTTVIEGCEGGQWKYIEPTTSGLENSCSWKTASIYCFSKDHLEEAPFLSYGVVRQTEKKTRYSSESFGATEAKIGCREMGFSQGGKVIPSTSFKAQDDPIIIKCNGNEKSLMECPVISGTVDKTKFASIACETGESIPADGTLKINEDFRVLIVKNGVWGGLCADSWTDKDATVVCKQLKGATSGKSLKRSDKLDVKYTNFKEALNCVGTENNLKDCPVDQTTETYCRESAGVYCDNHQAEASKEEVYPALPGFPVLPTTTPSSTQGGDNTASTQASFATVDDQKVTESVTDTTSESGDGKNTANTIGGADTASESGDSKNMANKIEPPTSVTEGGTDSTSELGDSKIMANKIGCCIVLFPLVLVTTMIVLQ